MNDETQTTTPAETDDAPPSPEEMMSETPDAEKVMGQSETPAPEGSSQTDESDDDDEDEDDDAPSENGKAKKAPNGLYISTPEPLKGKIEAEAAALGKTPRAFVRDFLAAHWGLVLTPARTRTTYESPEQKKEALKQKRQEKNALIKRLLEEHEKAQAAAAAEAAKLAA